MLEDSLPVNEFLCHESSSNNHCQAAVLEPPGLHEAGFFGIFGLESERVKTNLPGKVSLQQETGLVKGDILGFDPFDGGALLLGGSDGDGQC